MKLDKIKIKNFKSLKNIELGLSNLTLITGVNSSGKSSFLQSLLLFKENIEAIQLEGYFRKYSGSNLKLKLPKKNISFNGIYINLGNESLLLNHESSNDQMIFEINAGKDRLHIEINPQLEIEHKEDSNFDILNIFDDNYFRYLNTDRESPTLIFPFSETHIKKGLIGLKGEYTAHYLAENRHQKLEIKGLQHPDSQTLLLLENTDKWLGEISSGISISANSDRSTQSAKLTYQYEYGNTTTSNYSPLNVGFGLTYVLPVIVLILNSKPGDLIIIENPESHLHPKGQSKIAELCAIAAHNGVQIIIESHSDHLLNGLRVATKDKIIKPEESKIYYFRKVDDRLDTVADAINIDKDGNLDDYPLGFFDEWDNNIDKLLGL